jgi:D-glycero-D-manno-heptose 1,7-bisphosphate phosphatase
MAKKYILLDRDGTIIYDKHYLSNPDDLELLPSSAKGLRQMQQMGFGLVMITNQSGVARGYFSEQDVKTVNDELVRMLKNEDVSIDGIFYCPHVAQDNCECRKPKTGLAKMAAKALNFELESSIVIGDKSSDIEMGKAIGATTILVRTGKGKSEELIAKPDFVANNLSDCAKIIKLLNFNEKIQEMENKL